MLCLDFPQCFYWQKDFSNSIFKNLIHAFWQNTNTFYWFYSLWNVWPKAILTIIAQGYNNLNLFVGMIFFDNISTTEISKKDPTTPISESFSRSNHHHYSQIPLFELEPFPIFLLQWNFWFESQTRLSVILYQVFLSNSNYYIKKFWQKNGNNLHVCVVIYTISNISFIIHQHSLNLWEDFLYYHCLLLQSGQKKIWCLVCLSCHLCSTAMADITFTDVL